MESINSLRVLDRDGNRSDVLDKHRKSDTQNVCVRNLLRRILLFAWTGTVTEHFECGFKIALWEIFGDKQPFKMMDSIASRMTVIRLNEMAEQEKYRKQSTVDQEKEREEKEQSRWDGKKNRKYGKLNEKHGKPNREQTNKTVQFTRMQTRSKVERKK